ncbi:hypothetical protein LCGC14_2058830 [marine sediment metagenome]|uniref:Uncharacterized protein n=1 Tax=marine sediment metagenome TaxID=412755 RepID=A0A0F9F954_9ZZZZ
MTRGVNGKYYALTGFSDLKYWRFTFSDVSNIDGYIEIGRIWLGTTTTLLGPARTSTERIIDTTIKSFSRTGQIYSDTGYRYKVFDVTFPYWTDTIKNSVEDFIKAVGGAPFYVAFSEDSLDKLPIVYDDKATCPTIDKFFKDILKEEGDAKESPDQVY